MDQKFVALKRYPGLRGIDDDLIRKIADDCEMIRLKKGEYLHRSGEILNDLYIIIEGRLEEKVYDLYGNVTTDKKLIRGTQFGAVAGAEIGPIPIDCIALEQSVVLRMDYNKMLDYVASDRRLLINYIQDVAGAFKQSLRIDRLHTRANIITVLHHSPETRKLTENLIDRLQELGERPCVLTDDPKWQARTDVPQVQLLRNGEWIDDSEVRHHVAKWAANDRVFIDLSLTASMEKLIRAFQLSQLVLPISRPSLTEYQSVRDRVVQVQTHEPAWQEKTSLIWFLGGEDFHPPLVSDREDFASMDIKLSLEDPPENYGPILQHGLERLVHKLRGVQVGIALGGGAARGMAHLGVMKALEQNGIIVDMIAGTSAGAMTGTVYAAGLDVDYAVSCFVRDLTPSWIFRNLRHGGYWYLLYKYRRGQFGPMLRKYLSHLCLQQLAIPMNSITVDLVSGEPKIRDRGDSVKGILESINLPGLSPPICHDGQALVDGGLINNVPADVLVQKGCNFVIAVSVTAQLEKEFANIRPDSTDPKHKSPSVMQTILRGYMVQSVNMNSIGVQPADMMLDVDVTDFDLSEFTRTDELAEVGSKTTQSAMNQIRAELAKLDDRLFA